MKALFFLFILAFTTTNISAQIVLGEYNQASIIAPDQYRDSESNVIVTKDRKHRKKVWVKGLIPNATFYAILYQGDEDAVMYTVPKQKAGNYTINLGCLVYEDEQLVINLNNKMHCMGISQSDYDVDVNINKDGIGVGDVKIDKNGKVVVGGVGIDKDKGVNINTKDMITGIQYVGTKTGRVDTPSDDNDDDHNDDNRRKTYTGNNTDTNNYGDTGSNKWSKNIPSEIPVFTGGNLVDISDINGYGNRIVTIEYEDVSPSVLKKYIAKIRATSYTETYTSEDDEDLNYIFKKGINKLDISYSVEDYELEISYIGK